MYHKPYTLSKVVFNNIKNKNTNLYQFASFISIPLKLTKIIHLSDQQLDK